MSTNKLLLAFYGDDFTGSTDALEFLSRAGLKAVLFIAPPTAEQLAAYPEVNAIGVAGFTRSLPPEKMEAVLQPAFEQLKALQPRHVHYKVCSTFDSSPEIGSIGRAMDVGTSVFANSVVPLFVAAPVLGRYCVFGNLFARMGIGSNGVIHRLDRHPSMRNHPVTPADESDLRLHLGRQTQKKIGLLDILQVSGETDARFQKWEALKEEGFEVVLIDALYDEQLQAIGELMDGEAGKSTLFSVGSSGVEMALGKHWNAAGTVQPRTDWAEPGEASPLLVLSGSYSPVTKAQLAWAVHNGFQEVALQVDADTRSLVVDEQEVVRALQAGRSVVVHTRNIVSGDAALSAEAVGAALGRLGRKACEAVNLTRLVVAGGDTSSYTARALGIEAVEMIAPLVPGAPLCRAFATGSPVDGIEINFKGGQVGAEDYFGVLHQGSLPLKHKPVN